MKSFASWFSDIFRVTVCHIPIVLYCRWLFWLYTVYTRDTLSLDQQKCVLRPWAIQQLYGAFFKYRQSGSKAALGNRAGETGKPWLSPCMPWLSLALNKQITGLTCQMSDAPGRSNTFKGSWRNRRCNRGYTTHPRWNFLWNGWPPGPYKVDFSFVGNHQDPSHFVACTNLKGLEAHFGGHFVGGLLAPCHIWLPIWYLFTSLTTAFLINQWINQSMYHICINQSTYLFVSICLPSNPSISSPISQSIYWSGFCQSIYLHLSIYLKYLSIYLSTYLAIYLQLSIYSYVSTTIYLQISIYSYLSILTCLYLSIYICMCIQQSIDIPIGLRIHL